MTSYATRWQTKGSRPVRIANCSGYKADPGYHMRLQASLGDVDFITGDYLAEVNIAENAEAMAAGNHPGWEQTAWDGIEQTIDLLQEKRIKVIVNGGAQNPKGLAWKVWELIKQKGYDLKVAYVEGDNLLPIINDLLKDGPLPHLDSNNPDVHVAEGVVSFVNNKDKPIVSANAYLGAREIVKGLEEGADIVIAGRVADASPVIGAAWYWHSWRSSDFDALAGALIAGHLIECSSYVTGSNFSNFYEHPLSSLYDLVFGIAEVSSDGSCVITKHERGKGIVTPDTVKCQFLYELQGNVYLNSDVKAYLDNVQVEQVGKDRVKVWGIKGAPPPSTTKLAVFYRGGYQSEVTVNATGYATKEKWNLYEEMIRFGLQRRGVLDQFEVLEFQRIGIPEPNPRSQNASTTYLRIFAQAASPNTNLALAQTLGEFGMQHFSGYHGSLDMRTVIPRPFLSYYPALYPQGKLHTSVTVLPDASSSSPNGGGSGGDNKNNEGTTYKTTAPPITEPLEARRTYETTNPVPLSSFGPTQPARLGDLVLARSGDKGGNANIGFFVRPSSPVPGSSSSSSSSSSSCLAWDFLRSLLTVPFLQSLLGDDWRPEEYYVERIEFPKIYAVHFVVYGILGKGVMGSARLDGLGKGVADWLRDRVVDIPTVLLEEAAKQRKEGRANI